MVEKQHAEAIENNQEVLTNQGPDVVIITGMSGAGRTEAMHTFEDLGYFCIDNLPPSLIMNMISLASLPGHSEIGRKLAIVCDARNREYFKQLVGELAMLRQQVLPFVSFSWMPVMKFLLHAIKLLVVVTLSVLITHVLLRKQLLTSVN